VHARTRTAFFGSQRAHDVCFRTPSSFQVEVKSSGAPERVDRRRARLIVPNSFTNFPPIPAGTQRPRLPGASSWTSTLAKVFPSAEHEKSLIGAYHIAQPTAAAAPSSSSSSSSSSAASASSSAAAAMTKQEASGGVIYWMFRDVRAEDNWALLLAQELANRHALPLRVVFCLPREYLRYTKRQFHFLLESLKEVEADLAARGIPLDVLLGAADQNLAAFAHDLRAACVVADFSPLHDHVRWTNAVAQALAQNPLEAKSSSSRSSSKVSAAAAGGGGAPLIPLIQVDAHNIVPVWEAAEERQYMAKTFRPRVRWCRGQRDLG
jgi:hypothetical protein